MAVRSFRNSNRRAALFAALAVLALPGVALAAPDDGDRGGRRDGGGEARPDGAGRGNWTQGRGQAVERVQPAQPQPVERSWRGPNSTGWTPPAVATGRDASAPVARTQTGWAGTGRDGNDGRPRGVRVDGNGRGDGRGRDDGNGRGWTGRGSPEVATPAPGWRGPVRVTDDRRGDGRETRTDDHHDRNGGWRDGSNGNYRDGRRDDHRSDSWRGDRNQWGHGDNNHRWDHSWRDNNRYNWHSWRSHNRDIFRWGSYYSPYRNYSYRRLNIGFFLDSMFYSNRYWINDPWQYRLPDAYGPYRWVRYYDDALLVDIYSGEVVDVINNFFW
jgi:hypothetical protein